jgi:hypothetical protein
VARKSPVREPVRWLTGTVPEPPHSKTKHHEKPSIRRYRGCASEITDGATEMTQDQERYSSGCSVKQNAASKFTMSCNGAAPDSPGAAAPPFHSLVRNLGPAQLGSLYIRKPGLTMRNCCSVCGRRLQVWERLWGRVDHPTCRSKSTAKNPIVSSSYAKSPVTAITPTAEDEIGMEFNHAATLPRTEETRASAS